jgi:hypothetical protein
MDIENATILTIYRRTGGTAAGGDVFDGGTDAGGTRCEVGSIENNQRYELGAKIKDCSRVVYLPKSNWSPTGLEAPGLNDRMLIAIDDEATEGELGQILAVKDEVLEDLSHWVLFLKKVSA